MKKQGDIWVWQGGFDTRHLPKGAGFRWDPERKIWWTKILDVAAKLAAYAQGADKAELETYLARKAESLAGSRAADADIEVPAPEGLSYLPFQKAGIAYCLKKFGIEVIPNSIHNGDREEDNAEGSLPTYEPKTEGISAGELQERASTRSKREGKRESSTDAEGQELASSCICEDARDNEQTRSERETPTGLAESTGTTRPEFQGREWEPLNRGNSRGVQSSSPVGIHSGIPGKDKGIAITGNSYVLQSGLRESEYNDSNRVRWSGTLEKGISGRKERRGFNLSWMEGLPRITPNVGVLIGDEPGLGKTIQAIGIINSDWGISRILVICPNSLKINWMRELKKWLTRNLSVGIADGGNWPTTQVVIVNYDILVKHEEHVKGPWDLLVVDECHRVKNPKAQRTQQILGAQDKDGTWKVEPIKATRRLFLTGTPLVNRPIELWGIVHALAPETFTSFWGFAKRYCNAVEGRYGWDMTGSSNLGELQDKLRASIMVRRLKEQVLQELPPKRRQVIEVATNGAKGVVDAERESYATHQERLVELKAQVEVAKAGTDDEYNEAVKTLREGAQLAFTEMSAHRHDVALAKVPAVVEHIKDTIEGGKAVVFAHHHDVIDAIATEFPGCSVLTGRDSIDAKQAAVDRFQSDEACRVFVGSIQAAGVGITLTAASHVVFAELSWVPGDMSQAEDRCHRIGQKDSVLVQHLVLDGSIDSIMAKTLVAKQDVIDKALDVQQPVSEPVIPVDAPATEGISRKHLETPQIKPECVAAIHTALRMLAGVCDGAQNLDGVGFNKIDTAVGKSLANQLTITPRQALLGTAIVRKYRWQVPEEVYHVAMGGKE